MDGQNQSLISYRLRTVRVGVQTTLLVLAALLLFVLIPSSVEFENRTFYMAALVATAVGAGVISVLPWRRLFEGPAGMRAMYAWSVLDIVLISILVGLTDGDQSPLFLLFGLTSVFFAASYPPRAQVALLLFTFAAYSTTVVVVDEHIVAATFVAHFSILAALTFITSFLARELMAQNATLETEVAKHQTMERRLRRSEADLEEAQEVARLGSWSWDVKENRITWSEQLFHIYGIDPGDSPGDYGTFMSYVHEDDRQGLNDAVQRALDENAPFSFDHRVALPGGETRCVQARGRVEVVDGEPLRMVGTALDITERKKNEENERRVHELQVRHTQAVEINDNVVQGLAVASYALDAGDHPRAKAAVQKTLIAARSIVNQLLNVGSLKPGDLVRSKSADVITYDEEADAN